MHSLFIKAIFNVFAPNTFFLIALGVGSGIIVGALPGLTATMAIALLVPFTFTMNPIHGLVLLGGIYCGAIYGGSFSAILINTPGTPSAIATTFDGYALAKKGDSYKAIVTATISSVIGGLIGVCFLIFLSPPLSKASLKFGPPEFFWLTVFGLTIIATLASKSILKGLIGGAFGLLVSTIGIASIGGNVRFTFGTLSLQDGIGLIPALIGIFCIPEVINMVEQRDTHYNVIPYRKQKDVVKNVTLKLLKRPEGVAAAEASNNAEVSGSLIPLLTLGIPGAPPAAVLLGALLLQGMRPGAELFSVHGHITYTFIISLIIANLLILPMGIYSGKLVSKLITNIPVAFLAPFVVFLSVIGSYSINRNLFNVYVMLFFGLVGYIGRKVEFGPGPIVLGLILGKICEEGLVQSILMGRAAGSILQIFFTRPISIILIFLTIISAGWPVIRKFTGGKRRYAKRG